MAADDGVDEIQDMRRVETKFFVYLPRGPLGHGLKGGGSGFKRPHKLHDALDPPLHQVKLVVLVYADDFRQKGCQLIVLVWVGVHLVCWLRWARMRVTRRTSSIGRFAMSPKNAAIGT